MQKDPQRRKPFFRFVKRILRLFFKKPRIINYNDEELDDCALYLSNHVGAQGPLRHELWFPKSFRFWGTYEMTDSYPVRFRYLWLAYFHRKKKINKFLAFLITIVACPVLHCFYRGMRLIPTYADVRLVTTIKKSMKVLDTGASLIIFPENSYDGYHDVLTEYFAGFLLLARTYYKKTGKDLPIYNMYYHRGTNTLLIDKKTTYLTLRSGGKGLREIAGDLKDGANALGARYREELAKGKK